MALIMFCFISLHAKAEESIPLPPDRPDVLNVSPSYIKQLRERRAREEQHKETPTVPSPRKSDPKKTLDERTRSEVAEIDSQDLLNVLENKPVSRKPKTQKKKASRLKQSKTAQYAPIPRRKPRQFNDIEPSARGEKNIEANDENYSETLVSFAMQPEQIKLNEGLKSFLSEHAIRLFQENKNLKMEIHAYATPIEGELHSEVRISLARALEVRSFLISKSIPPNRLKLSPMGKDHKNDTDDRIDLLFIDKNAEN